MLPWTRGTHRRGKKRGKAHDDEKTDRTGVVLLSLLGNELNVDKESAMQALERHLASYRWD